MKYVALFISVAIAAVIPTKSFSQAPPPIRVAEKPTDDNTSRIEFFIAKTEKGDSQFSATIRDTGEEVYFVEMINVDRDDISVNAVSLEPNAQPAIKLTFENAAKKNMATMTANNIGKRLAICIDDEVISAPKIQSGINGEAIITGKFTSEEIDEIVSRLSPPSFRSQLIVIKSDWSSLSNGETISTDLREALKGVSVPNDLVAKLPASGPDILFPPSIVSCYTPEHYADLLSWLHDNNLLVSITSFPTPTTDRVLAGDGFGHLGPYHKTSLTQPVKNYGAESLFKELETNKLFVTYKAVIQWRLALLSSGPKPRIRFERESLLQEHKRGQSPNAQRQIDVSAHETTLPRNHVWIMNAFPGNADFGYRTLAKQDGFIPLIVSMLDSVVLPDTSDDERVRIPDVIENIVVNHVSLHSNPASQPTPGVSFKVIGSVNSPGIYKDLDEGIRLLDAIAVAGGLTAEAGDDVTIVRTVDKDQEPMVVEVSIAKAKQDSRMNLQIEAGDVVAIESREDQTQHDSRMIEAFALRSTEAETLAKTLSQLFRDDVAVAADRKENRLLIHASRERLAEVRSLIEKIEAAPSNRRGVSTNSPEEEAASVEQLRRKYQASEKAAFEAAAAAKKSERDGRRDRRSPQNIAELKRIVADSYATRRALHQAEVANLEERAKQIRESIAQRDRIADQIIDRRVEDLLDPSLQWEVDSDATIESSTQQTSAFSKQHNDELSAYRTFLWDALGPLLSKRNERLSDIASVEQSLVDLEGTIDIPEDADPETKKRLEQEQWRVRNRVASLADALKALREELAPVERQIALLKQKLADSSNEQVAVEGAITAVTDNQVWLSIGSDDGAGKGNRLPVFRDDRYVGDVEIVEIHSNKSVARILNDDTTSPIRSGDRATILLDTQAARLIGQDPGESIYNDRLKRFKFKLEKVHVTSSAEMAEQFWVRYRGRGYPSITGVWSDPRTNSLIIVGPPEADQPIRDTIAEWEGLQTGVEFRDQYSLDAQSEQLQRRRKSILEEIATRKLEIIDAEAQGEKADSDRLVELNRRLESETSELDLIDRKLQVISDSITQLNTKAGGRGIENVKDATINEIDRSSREAIRDKLRQRLAYIEAVYRAGKATLTELLSAANSFVDAEVQAAADSDEKQSAWRKHTNWLGRLKDTTTEQRDAGVASVADLLAVEVELLRAEAHLQDDTPSSHSSRPDETAGTPAVTDRSNSNLDEPTEERYREIIEEIFALRVREQEVLAKYDREHPQVKEVQQQLASTINMQARQLNVLESRRIAAESDYKTAQLAARIAEQEERPEAELKELEAQVQETESKLKRITEVIENAKRLNASALGDSLDVQAGKDL